MLRIKLALLYFSNKITSTVFYYLLNGGALPPIVYNTKPFISTSSYYIQAYLKGGKYLSFRVYTSYFKAPPLNGLSLAIKKVRAGEETNFKDFYLDALESMAYYAN